MAASRRLSARLGTRRSRLRRRAPRASSSVTAAPAEPDADVRPARAAVVCVAPASAESPFVRPPALGLPPATWHEALAHVARRVEWSGARELAEVHIFAPEEVGGEAFGRAVAEAELALLVGIRDERVASSVAAATAPVPTALALDCCDALRDHTRVLFQPGPNLLAEAAKLIPWSQAAKDARLLETAHELFDRRSPGDLLYLVLVLIDSLVAPVPELAGNKPTGLREVGCMVKNCRTEIVDCVTDPTCKAALDCLTDCGLNDQVCSYRCIVSYESKQFENFSLCNLQKHNCLGNSAERPELPDVLPLPSFRGEPLTHELAEEILEGWLDSKPWSWLVVSGQNEAYDKFPCQHQLFYREKKAFWYDPVFKVKTLDGKEVWRRRHYRVKRGEIPGTFYFSVLDNGVTSLEYWRIADVADDLSWGLFYYAGAATAAGQAYSGAVFATPDGNWPEASQLPRVEAALDKCGIALWEMYDVDNSCCDGAPLGVPADA